MGGSLSDFLLCVREQRGLSLAEVLSQACAGNGAEFPPCSPEEFQEHLSPPASLGCQLPF